MSAIRVRLQGPPAGLARLDARFYEAPEDLAMLAMRHVERSR